MTEDLEITMEEFRDKQILEQTQVIIATCSNFGNSDCDYIKEGIPTYCLFCNKF